MAKANELGVPEAHKVRVARARFLLEEQAKLGGPGTRENLDILAEREYGRQVDHAERRAIVKLAVDLEEVRMQQPSMNGDHEEAGVPKKLTSKEARAITRDYLRENPQATTAAALEHVRSHGTLPIKASSFGSAWMPELRRELGITYDRRRVPGAQSPGRAPKRAKGAAAAPVRGPEPEAAPEPAPLPAVIESPEPAHAPNRIAISAGMQWLTATQLDGGAWKVEFCGTVEDEGLDQLVGALAAEIRRMQERAAA